MSKLKPCPFCGSEAAEPIFIGNDNTRRRKVTIRCKAPGCTQGVTVAALRFNHDWCHQEAVEKWNNRSAGLELTAANARLATLEAENKALREALEPFARDGDLLNQRITDCARLQHRTNWGQRSLPNSTIGDLRRAAALLEKKR